MDFTQIVRDILLLVAGAWLAFVTFRALRSGKTYSVYGPALSTDRKQEPGAFWLVVSLQIVVSAVLVALAAWGFWGHAAN